MSYLYVYPGTNIKYPFSVPSVFVTEKIRKKTFIIFHLDSNPQQEIRLEQVTASVLRKRKCYFVYPDTAQKYEGLIPTEAYSRLEQENNKTFLRFIANDASGQPQEVRLEQISAAVLRQREYHYVYPDTNLEYKGVIPAEAYSRSEQENGKNFLRFNFNDEVLGQYEVRLEQVTAAVLRQRKYHYVYPNTNIKYEESILPTSHLKLEKIKGKTFLHFTANDQILGQREIYLEQVNAAVLGKRKCHYVFPNTNQEYKGLIPAEAYLNPEQVNGKTFLNFSLNDDSGQKHAVRLEKITASLLWDRKPRYVYPNTDQEYKGVIPAEAYLNPSIENNKTFLRFKINDEILGHREVCLEQITSAVLHKRIFHYVYPNTNQEYKGLIPAEAYSCLEQVDGKVFLRFTLEDEILGQREIRLEQLTAEVLRQRSYRYVYPNTDQEYKALIPVEAYSSPEQVNGKTFLNFSVNDTSGQKHAVRLEQVTSAVLRGRKCHYVYPNTDQEYKAPIPVESYSNPEQVNGKTFLNFSVNDASGQKHAVRLEQVTPAVLRGRKCHYVYPNTDQKYKETIPVEAFLNPEQVNGKTFLRFIVNDELLGQHEVRLERVTAAVLRGRKSRYVYLGTDQEFKGLIPTEAYLNPEQVNGKTVLRFTINDELLGQHEVCLEQITTAALQFRKYRYVYPNTDQEYKEFIPAEAYLNPEQVDGKTFLRFTVSNELLGQYEIRLEQVSTTTLCQRKCHYVYPNTEQEYKESIPAEAFLSPVRENGKTFLRFTATDVLGDHHEVCLEQVTATALSSRKNLCQRPTTSEPRAKRQKIATDGLLQGLSLFAPSKRPTENGERLNQNIP